MRACPLQAHWLDGEPISGVLAMAGVARPPPRRRRLTVTGVAAVGDAWACTNPSTGRGIALGARRTPRCCATRCARPRRSRRLRRRLARDDGARAGALVPRHGRDRPRAARADDGRPRGPRARTRRPSGWARSRAAMLAVMGRDAEVFRAALEISNVLAHPREVFARPGFSAAPARPRGAAGRTAAARPEPRGRAGRSWRDPAARGAASVDSAADAPPGHVLAQRHAVAVADLRLALQVLRLRDAPAAPARARRGRAAARRRRAAQRQGAARAHRRRAGPPPRRARAARRAGLRRLRRVRRVVLRARARARAAAAHQPRRARPRRPRAPARGDGQPGADARVAAARPRRPPGARRRRTRRCGWRRCAPRRS